MTLIAAPVRAGGEQQVGLAAEEGRDLQDVHRFGDRGAVVGQVHVGQDRAADPVAHRSEDAQALVAAEAASRRDRGAVRLVVRALEDQAGAGGGTGGGQALGDHQGVVAALELAGAGDQRERGGVRDRQLADGDGLRFGHGGGLPRDGEAIAWRVPACKAAISRRAARWRPAAALRYLVGEDALADVGIRVSSSSDTATCQSVDPACPPAP